MQPIERYKRTALVIAGAAILVNAGLATLWSNLHAGIWFTYALGLILLVWGLLRRHLPRWLRGLLSVGLTVAVVWVLLLYGYGMIDTADYREDAVIVLGTGIRGSELSDSLRSRLDCALAYHAQNPDALIAVSGGQGPQEDMPEGEAMAAYLLAQGIPAEQIICEAHSTNTKENFAFTRPLLDARLGEHYRIAYISNDFHLFRAGRIAADCGFANAAHLHAPTPWYMLIPNGLRECAALVKYWLGI